MWVIVMEISFYGIDISVKVGFEDFARFAISITYPHTPIYLPNHSVPFSIPLTIPLFPFLALPIIDFLLYTLTFASSPIHPLPPLLPHPLLLQLSRKS